MSPLNVWTFEPAELQRKRAADRFSRKAEQTLDPTPTPPWTPPPTLEDETRPPVGPQAAASFRERADQQLQAWQVAMARGGTQDATSGAERPNRPPVGRMTADDTSAAPAVPPAPSGPALAYQRPGLTAEQGAPPVQASGTVGAQTRPTTEPAPFDAGEFPVAPQGPDDRPYLGVMDVRTPRYVRGDDVPAWVQQESPAAQAEWQQAPAWQRALSLGSRAAVEPYRSTLELAQEQGREFRGEPLRYTPEQRKELANRRMMELVGLTEPIKLGGAGRLARAGAQAATATTAAEPAIAPPFYSKLEQVVDTKMAGRAQPGEVRKLLESQGVKADEIKSTGLDEWLAERSGQKVTKAEVQEYLLGNKVEIKEVVKGTPVAAADDVTRHQRWRSAEDAFHNFVTENAQRYDTRARSRWPEEARAEAARLMQARDEAQRALTEPRANAVGTKYEQYTLPGGENYRELLLTLPAKTPQPSAEWRAYEQWAKERGIHPTSSDARQRYKDVTGKEAPTGPSASEIVADMTTNYRSSHWDEPNVLAHLRFNERVDAEGKRVMLVEEVQSDWHQAGKKEGYQDSGSLAKLRRRQAEVKQELEGFWARDNATLTPEELSRKGALEQEYWNNPALSEAAKGVPPAPFALTWPELTTKRVIRWAAENGFDRVAWTPGKVHNERWGTERLAWQKKGDGYAVTVEPQIGGHAAGVDIQAEAEARKLIKKGKPQMVRSLEDVKALIKDTAGMDKPGAREVAENRTIADKLWKRMQAQDAGIYMPRAEGMDAFYNTILPEVANKLGKKWGARVKATEIPASYGEVARVEQNPQGRRGWYWVDRDGNPTQGPFATREIAQQSADEAATTATVHAIDLTPQWKRSVMYEGQPLFQGIPGAAIAAAPVEGETEEERQQRTMLGTAAMVAGAVLGRGKGGVRVRPVPPARAGTEIGKLRQALGKQPDIGGSAKDRLITELYDRVYPAQAVEKATGVQAYKLARVVPHMAAYGEALVEKQVQPVLKTVGQDVKPLEEYMVLQRSQDLRAINPQAKLPGGVTDPAAALQALEVELGPQRWAQVQRSAQDLFALNDRLVLQPLLQEGIIDPARYQAIKQRWPHYIPFYRADFDLSNHLARGGGGAPADVKGNFLKRISEDGSERALDNPLARWQAQIIRTQTEIARNKAARALVEGLEQWGTATNTSLVQRLKEETNAAGVVHWVDSGQKKYAQVPLLYAKMAKGLDAEPANFFSKFLMATAQPLRAGAVTLNPEYLAVNPFRDLISAWYREKLVPLSPEYVRGWRAAISHNADWEEAAKAGVLSSGFLETARNVDDLKRVRQLGGIRVENVGDMALLLPRLIQKGGTIGEQATRIATYHKLRGQGLTELEAGIRSLDVTVDFQKSGNTVKLINQAIPFLNAGIQGAANTVELMRRNPKAAILGAAPLAAMSAAFFVNNQRYETADKIPPYEYAIYWPVIVGEGTKKPDPRYPTQAPEQFPIYFKIPKGPLGALLTAPVEAALQIGWGQNDRSVLEHMLEAGKVMATAMSPIEPTASALVPPILGTAVQVQAGKDFFRGRDIEPEREQSRPPEQRYGPETSKLAILAGQGAAAVDSSDIAETLGLRFKVSPRMIDFAIKDMTAGVGQQFLWLTSMALEALGYNPEPPGETRRQQLTDVEQAAQTPVIKRFLGTKNTQGAQDAADDMVRAADEARRLLYQNEEVRRFGLGVNPVAPGVNVDGKAVELTPAQRLRYQQDSAAVAKAGLDVLTASAYYRGLDDAAKQQAIQSVRSHLTAMARENIAQTVPGGKLAGQQPPYTQAELQQDAQTYATAWAEYNALPKYRNLGAQETQQADAALSKIRALAKDKGVSQERALAMYRQTDAAGAQAAQRALNLGANPARKAYLRKHPELTRLLEPVD